MSNLVHRLQLIPERILPTLLCTYRILSILFKTKNTCLITAKIDSNLQYIFQPKTISL
eukprot:UN24991